MNSVRYDHNSTKNKVSEAQSNSSDQLALGEICMVLRHGSARRRRAVIIDKRPSERGTGNEYYVHYEGTDRRLDEWAQRSQIQKVIAQRDVSLEEDRENMKSVCKTRLNMVI